MNPFEQVQALKNRSSEPKKNKQKRNRKKGNAIPDHVEKYMLANNIMSISTSQIITLLLARRRSVNSLMRRAELEGRFTVERVHGDRWKHPDNIYTLVKK